MVASWNGRTLQDSGLGVRRRTALIACELAIYDIDIAALSETRLPDEGSTRGTATQTGNTYFWSGLPKDALHIHGVGFELTTALLQSTQESLNIIYERLMTQRLHLLSTTLLFLLVSTPKQ